MWAKHYICNYCLSYICRCQWWWRLWKGLRQTDRAAQVLQGLQFLSSQLLRNECLTRLLPCWWHMVPAWQSLQQQLFTLLACLEGFFPPPKEGLWVSSVSFWCHCIWNIYSLYALQFQCWKEPQQAGVPKEQSKHLEATVPQTGQLGISSAQPSHCKVIEGLVSWNHCCLPEIGPRGTEGPFLFSDELFWNPKYNLMILGFFYYLLEAVLVVSSSRSRV